MIKPFTRAISACSLRSMESERNIMTSPVKEFLFTLTIYMPAIIDHHRTLTFLLSCMSRFTSLARSQQVNYSLRDDHFSAIM